MSTFMNGLFNEQAFSLTVNGRNLLSVLMLPVHLAEFARGYLTTEAIISASEIESIMIDRATIGVLTRNPFKVLLPKRAVISGCGGLVSYLDPTRLRVISAGISISIETLAIQFPRDILNAGGHCAAAVLLDGSIFVAGDLSQSVALDKACGLLLRTNCSPTDAALIISSKPTADIIRKTINAGFSILAAYLAPTAMAVELAKTCRLTLVDISHQRIYSDYERIQK
ncbi:MAG TPA: formate dehydrogenase accessory sulfurtransferase FdhD [Methanocorpusculum sp.]|nr:formate dehydrogenase accessory sulfurtransferase FdhD [Methanocorpusculum sp.]